MRMGNAFPDRLTARRPWEVERRLASTARARSLTSMSPMVETRCWARSAAMRFEMFDGAIERLKRALRASCREVELGLGLGLGFWKVLTRKGMAPDEPMMGLFESSALRPRKLATMASETGGEH